MEISARGIRKGFDIPGTCELFLCVCIRRGIDQLFQTLRSAKPFFACAKFGEVSCFLPLEWEKCIYIKSVERPAMTTNRKITSFMMSKIIKAVLDLIIHCKESKVFSIYGQ
jgi:hypothetical protein